MEERQKNPFDLRDRPNPWPNACPQANNAWEAQRILEGTALLCGVDFKTAEDWVWDMEKRAKEPTELPRQERTDMLLDPGTRRYLQSLRGPR